MGNPRACSSASSSKSKSPANGARRGEWGLGGWGLSLVQILNTADCPRFLSTELLPPRALVLVR